MAAHLKLLLKLIQDHKDACGKEKNDSRRMLRVATMMTILDTVRTRIQKCQSFGNKRSQAALRRCNTDLRPNHPPRDKKLGGEVVADEKEKLRRELSSCMAARKSLEMMCSCLGKEKEIMAAELSRKVQELSGMEELISDLKAQNKTLVKKVQECALKHKDKSGLEGGESQGNAALQERNKFLSELLLRSHDGYRLTKKKLKEAQEENVMVCSTIDEMGAQIVTSLERIRRFKDLMLLSSGSNPSVDVQDEIMALENMFERFQYLVAKHDKKQGEFIELKSEINVCGPSVLLAREEDTTLDQKHMIGFNVL